MRRSRDLAVLALLLVATAVAYLTSLDGVFLFDDEWLVQDPLVRAPFAHGLLEWIGSARPVTTFTFAVNQLWGGVEPRGWHVTNLLLHLAAVVLAWRFARRTLDRAGLSEPALPALFAAALFALHPLQTESVSYLSQRAECLASGLFLAAMLLLLGRDEAATPGRRAAYLAGAVTAQALGALAKPIVATLPAAWLLHAALLPPPAEQAHRALARVRARLGAAAPLLAVSIASSLLVLSANRGSAEVGFEVAGVTPFRYLLTQLRVVPTYLRLALWPSGQCADWEVRVSTRLGEPAVIGGAILLACVVGGAVLLARRSAGRGGDGPAASRVTAFGALFFLLALAPTSSVFPILDPLAEHRVYLGLLGLACAAAAAGAWGARRLAGGRAPFAVPLAAVALLAALGGATAHRAAVWTSRLAFWTDTVAKAPGKARPHLNLGSTLVYEGRYAEAIEEFRRARALAGDGTVDVDDVAKNLVETLMVTNQIAGARRVVEEELRRAPGAAQPHALQAVVEYMAYRDRDAEAAASRALAIDPRSPMALKILGILRSERGDLPSARDLLRRAAAERGHDTTVFLELARVEERLGDRAAACAAYGRAAGDPGWPVVGRQAAEAARTLGCR